MEKNYQEKRRIITELPSRTKTMKVDIRVWDSLKNLKKENETFSDVIKGLLHQRTISLGDEDIKAIKYSRKIFFLETEYRFNSIGIEFEYNDIKNEKQDFVLDLKINKIFYGKRILNPSVFFGIDNEHKHFSLIFLNLYLKCVGFALKKEFSVYLGMYADPQFEDIAKWRKIYYDYNLSEESFKQDIEKPLKLSEEEKPSKEYEKKISKSIASSIERRPII